MTITFGFKSDAGKKRQTNEDSCAVLNRSQLHNKLDGMLVVGDGLGGRRGGEVASRELVDTMAMGLLEMTDERATVPTTHEMEQMLYDVIVRANGKIQTMSRFAQREDLKGMATTCVAALIGNGKLTTGNVGDSRIYLLRNCQLRQLTDDHSEVYAEYLKGNITQEEARNSKFRNSITRAVGLRTEIRPDIVTIPLVEGDTLLLCSDGLNTEIPDTKIAEILAYAPSAQNACDRLVNAALRNGGRDNVTVIVMRYGDFVPREVSDADLDLDTALDTEREPIWREPIPVREQIPDPDADGWDDDDDGFRYQRPTPAAVPRVSTPISRSRHSNAVPGYAQVIIGALALAVLVEGALLYHEMQIRVPVPTPPPVVRRLTDGPLTYDSVRTLTKKPVQSDFLLVSNQGNPVVATLDGTPTTITPSGQGIAEGTLFPQLPAEKLPTVQDPKHPVHAKPHADLTIDASGNYYYIDPQTKCIETFNSVGTRTNQDLGKGAFIAPTRIAVDPSGNIYVIDDNHLKVLSAHPVAAPPDHPKGANF